MEENITIEFVKEWIDKHNLTKDSFDRIMNDLIYNSGHNYIDNPSLRYWLIDNTYKFRDMLPVELNSDQQVVLEMLKEETIDRGNPYAGIYWLLEDDEYPNMSNKEFYQVLAAFAEWGLSHAEE
ncbi:hypothetical protein [Enterococcus dongliensis]|uniref:DUF1642 domain-containing protein n=1 Tax=Enterococcus dongliensis TaxID=2559925 RepID=A0AAW8TI60_9ENTE|nr:hypothetical protein [Enterococcus dongliensis]MDT2637961.1 hypothetical protein [Enterococcus dongliensis]